MKKYSNVTRTNVYNAYLCLWEFTRIYEKQGLNHTILLTNHVCTSMCLSYTYTRILYEYFHKSMSGYYKPTTVWYRLCCYRHGFYRVKFNYSHSRITACAIISHMILVCHLQVMHESAHSAVAMVSNFPLVIEYSSSLHYLFCSLQVWWVTVNWVVLKCCRVCCCSQVGRRPNWVWMKCQVNNRLATQFLP